MFLQHVHQQQRRGFVQRATPGDARTGLPPRQAAGSSTGVDAGFLLAFGKIEDHALDRIADAALTRDIEHAAIDIGLGQHQGPGRDFVVIGRKVLSRRKSSASSVASSGSSASIRR